MLSFGAAACSSDWDFLDPRVDGGDATGGASSTGGDGGGAVGGSATGGSATGGSNTGGSGQGGIAGGGGQPMPETLSFSATIAECIDVALPDPDFCETSIAGPGSMKVDTEADQPTYVAYLRFDLTGAPADKSATDVSLTLTVSNKQMANSDESGEVWQVEPFELPDLSNLAPNAVGTPPLAASLGPVAPFDSVEWQLPPSVITVAQSVYIAITPASVDGVNYDNLDGVTPPVLRVTFE